MSMLQIIEERIRERGSPLEMTDEELDSLSDADIAQLMEKHGGHILMRLPPRERRFFDWLRVEDPDVWNDLWCGDEDPCVALAFLPALRAGGRGFPICDLELEPNYYFTPRHIKPDGAAGLEGIIARAAAGGDLAVGEALMFEIVSDPIDIWHFAWKHGVPIQRLREVVAELVEHDWLAHLTEREDLARYIED